MKEREIAIVTGGSGGIGRCTAMSLAKAGCKVYELSRHAKEGTPGVEHLTADTTDEQSVQAAVAEVERREGRIDILVCNAGFGISGAAEYTSPDDAHAQLELNLYGADRAARAVIPVMRAQGGGAIINTSSMVSIYGQPSGCAYPASKFAVNGLTKSLARELAADQIRVNAVAPGVTHTDMVDALPKEIIDPLIATIPLGRMGEPEDIANAYVFLASDMASYISGVVLSVDGLARS